MKKFVKRACITAASLLLLSLLAVLAIVTRLKLDVPSLLTDSASSNEPLKNIVYKTADGKELRLDLYLPHKQVFTKAPAVFVFHGGSWNSGDKELNRDDIVNAVLDYGISIVSVEYRFTDTLTIFPAHLEDAADSVRFLSQRADRYGLDSSRFCVFGASAGGQIALMLALNGGNYGEYNDVPFAVKCAVSLCGPTDFLNPEGFTAEQQSAAEALLSQFFGGTKTDKEPLYREASPIYHLSKNAPPIFLVHGKLDAVVPFSQSQRFYDAAIKAGMSVTLIPVENAGHTFEPPAGKQISPTEGELIKELVQFLLFNLIG